VGHRGINPEYAFIGIQRPFNIRLRISIACARCLAPLLRQPPVWSWWWPQRYLSDGCWAPTCPG